MSTHGEAAEQIANMVTNVTVKGVEAVANITGKGALSLVTFLIAAMKDQKRTKGKVRMKSFQGKPTKVFVIKNSDLKQFSEEAKKYGVMYAAIINRKDPNGICDVIVNANDAARVNRIAERFELSSVDIEKIREDIAKSRQAKDTERERSNPPAEKQAHTVDEDALNQMMAEPIPQQTVHKQPIDINKENPTKGRTERSNQSEPSLNTSKNSAEDMSERPSVKGEINDIKNQRKAEFEKSKSQPAMNRQTAHKQPHSKRKSKGER